MEVESGARELWSKYVFLRRANGKPEIRTSGEGAELLFQIGPQGDGNNTVSEEELRPVYECELSAYLGNRKDECIFGRKKPIAKPVAEPPAEPAPAKKSPSASDIENKLSEE